MAMAMAKSARVGGHATRAMSAFTNETGLNFGLTVRYVLLSFVCNVRGGERDQRREWRGGI